MAQQKKRCSPEEPGIFHEEFRTSSGPSDASGNSPPVTIHTWLERFNKQKPHSFEKATAPVDAENWISHMEKIFDVMGCEDAFKTRLAVYKFEGNALAWWKAYKQDKGGDAWLIITNTETSTEFMQCFLRLAGFLRATAGTEEEQAKNFQWGLRRSTLNHLMCISYTDVAQVANAARNYEILYERDDDDAERPDKRQKSGDRHQPTSQQSSHRNHGHNNDRQGSDRRSGGDNHRSNNNYSGNNNRNFGNGRDQRNRGQQSNRSANSGVVEMTTTAAATTTTTLAVTTGILVMDATRETGVISPTDLPILVLSNPWVPLRVTPIQFALLVDVDTKESVELGSLLLSPSIILFSKPYDLSHLIFVLYLRRMGEQRISKVDLELKIMMFKDVRKMHKGITAVGLTLLLLDKVGAAAKALKNLL
nr:hypothetical protein [Tanacetum cinerariifolium]